MVKAEDGKTWKGGRSNGVDKRAQDPKMGTKTCSAGGVISINGTKGGGQQANDPLTDWYQETREHLTPLFVPIVSSESPEHRLESETLGKGERDPHRECPIRMP